MSLLECLSDATQAADDADTDIINGILQSVRRHLGMEVAYVSEFVGNDSVFRAVDAPGLEALIKPGDARSLDDVYCRHILAGRLPELIPDTSQLPLAVSMPITQAVPIGAHVSVPLTLSDGSVYGMFCCLSPFANSTLNERDLFVIRAFADIVARQIDRDRISNQDRESRVAMIKTIIDSRSIDIHVQPIWDFVGSRKVGFECLARFTHEPRRTPDRWFADAEDVGLGIQLELAAISAALAHASRFPEDIYLTINASANALMAPDFEAAIANFDPTRLVVELTEHGAVHDYDALIDTLDAYRQRGIRLAIDDAGAGFAGLQHIVRLKPDIIKLDMGLTRNVDTAPARRALASALIFYARETGCQILAEGIETDAELETLKQLGVAKGQGYRLGRPMPIDEAMIGLFSLSRETNQRMI
jgi:EAL domain-containing protein (putative c-di-GMP-specific phosphodiesterase class I)